MRVKVFVGVGSVYDLVVGSSNLYHMIEEGMSKGNSEESLQNNTFEARSHIETTIDVR